MIAASLRRVGTCLATTVCLTSLGLVATSPAVGASTIKTFTLTDVSCPTGGVACLATGVKTIQKAKGGPIYAAFSEQWTGGHWKNAAVLDGKQVAGLAAVSCVSASACWAVGGWGAIPSFQPAVASWNGQKWTPTELSGNGSLSDVACTTDGTCAATGETNPQPPEPQSATGATYDPSTSTWVGSFSGGMATSLSGVSCATDTACVGVGSTYDKSLNTIPYAAEIVAGGTSVAQPVDPIGATAAQLSDIACPAAQVCVAVGSTQSTSSSTEPLIETWNGTSWSLGPTVAPGGSLWSISCPTTSSCLALGTTGSGQDAAWEWNGTIWSQIADLVIPPGSTTIAPEAVSCSAGDACMVVGSETSPSGTGTLAESWNGTTWTVLSPKHS